MTTQEAIKILERLQEPEPYEPQITHDSYEALEMAIEALEMREKIPKKHGDLIDRHVLWDAMSKYNDNEGAKMPFGYDDTLIHRDSACFVIENAPTVLEAE